MSYMLVLVMWLPNHTGHVWELDRGLSLEDCHEQVALVQPTLGDSGHIGCEAES
jgi:hypothetical protein